MQKYQNIVVAMAFQCFFVMPCLAVAEQYDRTITESTLSAAVVNIWAPPANFGTWHILQSHAGDASTYVIEAEALGNAYAIVEVEYFDAQNRKVTRSFAGTITIGVGENVSNIRVRAKTTGPTGSGVRVTIR